MKNQVEPFLLAHSQVNNGLEIGWRKRSMFMRIIAFQILKSPDRIFQLIELYPLELRKYMTA